MSAARKIIGDRNYLRMLTNAALLNYIKAQPVLTELEQALTERFLTERSLTQRFRGTTA